MKFLRGFTLLELMIAIAILGIALGIAVPGFTDLLRSYRAQSQSSEITRTVALARSEAIKRGGNVYVTALTDGDNWEAGWRVWHDADSNGIYAAAELIRAFGPLAGNGVSLRAKATQLSAVSSRRAAPPNSFALPRKDCSRAYRQDRASCLRSAWATTFARSQGICRSTI